MYQSTLGAALERRFVCLGRRAIPAALVFVVNSAWAQAPTAPAACDPAPATAASVQGTVEAQRVGNAQWQPVKLNDKFCPGDTIRVGEKSRADIALLNQSVLRLNANSTITVETPKERRTGVIGLLRGATHVLSRGPNSLEVQTPFTLAGVRGTEFLLSLDGRNIADARLAPADALRVQTRLKRGKTVGARVVLEEGTWPELETTARTAGIDVLAIL